MGPRATMTPPLGGGRHHLMLGAGRDAGRLASTSGRAGLRGARSGGRLVARVAHESGVGGTQKTAGQGQGRVEWARKASGSPDGSDSDAALKSTATQRSDCGWVWMDHFLEKGQVWSRIREEVMEDSKSEPMLASFLYSTVLSHDSLDHAMAFILANKLQCSVLPVTQLADLFLSAFRTDAGVAEGFLADMLATYDRDPACRHYSTCMLYYKGFQAVQSQRIAHWLWRQGREAVAAVLQSRISEAFHVDIHPRARLGRGIMLDHATGVVIGETAQVGDNVSLLHHVTLGGSGNQSGDRHPKIGNGVLIGAGAVVLGNVQVGHCSKIGAGSVVLMDVPPHSVAVGVPARVLPLSTRNQVPVNTMDQMIFDSTI